MVVRVLDQGKGFELTEVPDPLAEENLLRTSGRGDFFDARVHGRIQRAYGPWGRR